MKRHLSLTFLSLCGALCLLGCDPPPSAADAGANANANTNANASADQTATADDPEACAKLAKQICDAAGEKTSTCASANSTTGLLSPATCAKGLGDIAFTLQKLADAGKVCTELGERLCKDIGQDTDSCKMVEEQLPNMAPEQCEKMNEQYDQVLADLQRRENANKPLTTEAAAKIATGDVPAFGPADATVTVVEFSDFQCPYCSRAATALTELKPKYGDRVRFVFRQFPLSFHQQAHLAAQASLAAHAQGKFWEYHDLVFKNQNALGRDALEGYAKELGLDMVAFAKALDEETYKAAVDAELELGQEVFVSGTPTMFVNGKRVANATDATAISSEIDKALGS